MSKEKYDNDVLVKALIGYVLIICIFLVVPISWGVDLAVQLANGLPPLFFLVAGGLLFYALESFCSKLQAYWGKPHE